jgi:hypothetical protein
MSFAFGNVEKLGDQVVVPIPKDEHGDLGRECPNADCERYFKIRPGTGLTGKDLPCHCPYCGHTGPTTQFYTPAQIEYGKSVALRQINDAIFQDLKQLEFKHRPPRGGFGIGLSLTVKQGQPVPIRHYREEDLETEVVCDHCTLHYAIYGLFAFCPDCRTHNSVQILFKNLDLVVKLLALSETQADEAFKRQMLEDALENCVSAFDGFGRETCKVRASKSSDAKKAQSLSFQNVELAADRVHEMFGVDLRSAVTAVDWSAVHHAFLKRHVVAHRSGVVDDRYIAETGDPNSVVGRRVPLSVSEVEQLVDRLRSLGRSITALLPVP